MGLEKIILSGFHITILTDYLEMTKHLNNSLHLVNGMLKVCNSNVSSIGMFAIQIPTVYCHRSQMFV